MFINKRDCFLTDISVQDVFMRLGRMNYEGPHRRTKKYPNIHWGFVKNRKQK